MPSDHAPVSIELVFPEDMINAKMLVQHAQDFCMHFIMSLPVKPCCKKPLPFKSIDTGQFNHNVSSMEAPIIPIGQNVDDMAMWFAEFLYNCAAQISQPQTPDT